MKIKHGFMTLLAATISMSFAASPIVSLAAAPKYVDTAPLAKPVNSKYKQGESCAGTFFGWAVLGYLKNKQIGYLKCERGVYQAARGLFKIDPKTLKPLVPATVPAKSFFGYSPMVYIKPQQISTKPKTAITPTSNFSDLQPCRIAEADYSGRPNMASGFPIPAERATLDEKLTIQVVPVDFPDLPTKTSPARDLSDALTAVEQFWEGQASTKVDLVFKVPSAYIRLPDRVAAYNLGGRFPNFSESGYRSYATAATAAADEQIDFKGADIVILAHTPLAKSSQISTFIAEVKSSQIGTFTAEAEQPPSKFAFRTAEKTVSNVMIQGADEVRDIQNWIHEFGHQLGVTDTGGDSGGAGMGFDVMHWYGNPELTIWNRFILGITTDSQLNCVTTPQASTHWVRPVAAKDKNTSGVVIPISANKAIVVESRRRLGYDALLGKESEGALVYVIDTTKSGNEGSAPFKVVGPPRMTKVGIWSLDAPLKKGESVSTNGWKISVVESGAFGDVVKVEKG